LLFNILGFVKTSADAALFIRFTLATLYTSSIVFFSYKTLADASLSVQKQRWQRRIFIIISMLQFHPLFWAGRTTPNGIVSPIVFMALALVFSIRRTYRKRDYYLGLSLLTASQVIARMELVGIVIPVAASGLISRSIGGSFVSRSIRIAVTGLLTALVSIGAFD
jgi:alpha-1,6-mannosyltransferase